MVGIFAGSKPPYPINGPIYPREWWDLPRLQPILTLRPCAVNDISIILNNVCILRTSDPGILFYLYVISVFVYPKRKMIKQTVLAP